MSLARSTKLVKSGALAVAAALAIGLLAACGDDSAEPASGAPASTPAAAADPVEFDIELGDIWVQPDSIEVPAGAPIVLHVTNVGHLPHDLKVNGQGTRLLDPGESETVTVGPFNESLGLTCEVPGHREAGMVMDVIVQ